MQLKQQTCYSFTQLLFIWLKWRSSSFRLHQVFPIFMVQMLFSQIQQRLEGAQWLSGRVFDSRPRGRGFEPHRRHSIVVLEQDTFILA